MKNLKRFQSLKSRDSKDPPLLSVTTNVSNDNLNAYNSGQKLHVSSKNHR